MALPPRQRVSALQTKGEKTSDTVDETPAPLPADVMDESEPGNPAEELPLHLRVLRALVEGQPSQERIDQALGLAHEVYELETANLALEHYRAAS
jgi:hypothetical protein